MATFIDGAACSANIDSSGEIIDIEGIDISSLNGPDGLSGSGVLNWEHKSDQPSQLIGKILKAKKIFSEADCANDRERYFWNKCQAPYVYIVGQLFDDYVDSAKHVAGLFRYDADNRANQARNVLYFSVEGAKIPGAVEGMRITRSIARKVTVTVQPCNHSAVAEILPGNQITGDDFQSVFKSESGIEIEMMKSEDVLKMLNAEEALMKRDPQMKISVPAASEPKVSTPSAVKPTTNTVIGKTTSGKNVMSHGKIGEYQGFTSADHYDAAKLHAEAGNASRIPAVKQHHAGKASVHRGAAMTAERMESKQKKFSKPEPAAKPQADHRWGEKPTTLFNPKLSKALEAGSPAGAPGTLSGGAALQEIDSKKKLIKNKKASLEKKEAIAPGPGRVGETESGKTVHNEFDHPDHKDFTHKDHLDAAEHHTTATGHYYSMAAKARKDHKDMQGSFRPTRTGLTARAKKYEGHALHHAKQASLHSKAANDLKPFSSQTYSAGKRTVNYKDGSDAHVPTMRELASMKKSNIMEKAVTRDQYGPAASTGHEKGVHVGTEFRETDKRAAGRSDAGEYNSLGREWKQSSGEGVRPGKSMRREGQEFQVRARKEHRRVLSELKAQPKPKLTKGEALEKGANGDWQKEGYSVSHEDENNVNHKGLRINAHDKNGKEIGFARFKQAGNRLRAHEVFVHPDHERKGLATAMYQHAEKHSGKKILPSPDRTPAGKALWDKGRHKDGAAMFGKSETIWIERAKEEFEAWEKKEQFIEFMSQRLPHLTKTEIVLFGQALALKKAMDVEQELIRLTNKKDK